MKHTRLFLFASYDRDGIIDDALVHYVRTLSKYGDVIFYMDCDAKPSETNKIKKLCIHCAAERHGEYDFGSYKRAYIYARDNKLLEKYDYVYLVNDSVFGPTMDISRILDTIESFKTDAVGMIVSKHRTHSFMESWFVALNKKIFTSKWFDDFMTSISHEARKSIITIKYEHGLSNLIKNNNCSWDGVYNIWGRYTYNHPKKLFKRGCPFIKKASFTRHNGAIGGQIKYILKHANPTISTMIMDSANRLYGAEYMEKFLTSNPIKIFIRNIKYAIHKIKDGEI